MTRKRPLTDNGLSSPEAVVPANGHHSEDSAAFKSEGSDPSLSREGLEREKLRRENVKLGRESEKLHLEKETLHRQARNLELQRLQLKNQYFRERLRALLDISIAMLAVFAAVVLLHEIWTAWHDQTVVLSPFQVAPAFENGGNNGTVIAGRLLDNLQNMQDATRASQEKRSVKDAWSNQLQVQIPEARITIADLQKYLRDLLGNPIHIGGSLVQEKGAEGKDIIALTVRGNGFAAKTFTGAPGDLTKMLQDAAEYIYGQSEPYLYGVYLATHGRMEDAVNVAKEHLATAVPSDKPLLLNLWGNYLLGKGDNPGGIEKFREAIAMQPNFWIAYVNIQAVQDDLGQEEASFQTGLEFERRAHRNSWWYAYLPDRIAPKVNPAWWSNMDDLRKEYRVKHEGIMEDMKRNGPGGTTTRPEAPLDAEVLANMHDAQGAELELESAPGAGTDPYVIAQSLLVRAESAADFGNYGDASVKLHQISALLTKNPDLVADFSKSSFCLTALADEFSGHPEQADPEVAQGGHIVDCYDAKGDIDDHRKQWAEAQQDYVKAVALAPSLPAAYESWGEALGRHGNWDAAIEKFAAANQRGPHWADPLERWGEALAAKGQYKDAVKKYERASEYAPHWGALYLHWGEALAKLGRRNEAVEKWHTAQSLKLSVQDSVKLTHAIATGATQP